MLFGSKQVEEHVVLRTHSHHTSCAVVVPTAEVFAENLGTTFSWLKKAEKHTNGRCLPRSIMAQKNEDLILVKFEIDAIHSLGAVMIGLFKILDFQNLLLLLLHGHKF